MVNGMQSRLLQHNQEIMARSQNSPTKPMPGGQRFSHYKDWIGSLQPAKYFSRNGHERGQDPFNRTTSLLNDSYATTIATPGVLHSSVQVAPNSGGVIA